MLCLLLLLDFFCFALLPAVLERLLSCACTCFECLSLECEPDEDCLWPLELARLPSWL